MSTCARAPFRAPTRLFALHHTYSAPARHLLYPKCSRVYGTPTLCPQPNSPSLPVNTPENGVFCSNSWSIFFLFPPINRRKCSRLWSNLLQRLEYLLQRLEHVLHQLGGHTPAPGEYAPGAGVFAPPAGGNTPGAGEFAPLNGAFTPASGACAPNDGAFSPSYCLKPPYNAP